MFIEIYGVYRVFISIFTKQIHIPAYSASLHFELYRSDRQDYFVQLFYRKSGENDPKPLNLPECGEMCPFDKFKELCEKFIPKGDIAIECQI